MWSSIFGVEADSLSVGRSRAMAFTQSLTHNLYQIQGVKKYNSVKNSLLCAIFVVEGKMLVVGSFKYSPFSFEKGRRIYP
jgi:hypothetical protein